MDKRRILYIALIIAVIVGSLIALPFFLQVGRKPTPTGNQPVVIPTTYQQRTTIKKTTAADLEKRTDVIRKRQLSDGSTEYQFDSFIKTQPDTAIVKNGTVTYEQVALPTTETDPKSKNVTEIAQLFGKPEEIIPGSAHFGNLVDTFAYPSKGFAFVGSLRTNEVLELQYFEPMTLEQYKQTYGKDISSGGGE